MVKVIMDGYDADRLLRLLYHGTRPARVHLLICGCGRSANLTEGDAAWLGWQVLPHPMCPGCLAGEPYPGAEARERYLELVEKLTNETFEKGRC